MPPTAEEMFTMCGWIMKSDSDEVFCCMVILQAMFKPCGQEPVLGDTAS